MKVRFSAMARVDVMALTDWLSERSPAAGDKAMAAIVGAIEMLADFPRAGLPLADGTREKGARFGRDGYIIRYQLLDGVLLIRRVFHTRQDRA
jgi:plasmid stabilization system protein ParE